MSFDKSSIMEYNSSNAVEQHVAVERYQLHNLKNMQSLQDLVHMVARICDTPIAYISIIDDTRQVFIAQQGLNFRETDRSKLFCCDTIEQQDLVVIDDASKHPKYYNYPYVTGDPHIRFYAGMPVKSHTGVNIGTLCVVDKIPKQLSSYQKESLKMLTSHIMYLMELRIALNMVDEQKNNVLSSESLLQEKYYVQNNHLKSLAKILSHQISGPVASMKGLMNLINSLPLEESKEYLPLMDLVINQMDDAVKLVTANAFAATD